MKIGIMVPSVGAFGQKGFYNMQEVGHAKALSKLCDFVEVYKLVEEHQQYTEEMIEGCENAKLYLLPSKRVGSNGIPNMSLVNSTLDVLLLCADTQLAVPKIERWAKKNNVRLIPYIGVIESHSTSKLKKTIMDLLFRRNLAVYQKYHCIAKTPKVKDELSRMGVQEITVGPVGLDFSLLHKSSPEDDLEQLRQTHRFEPEDRIVLMVGRMEEDRNPLDCVAVFRALRQKDPRYKLCLIGKGSLKDALFQELEQAGLLDAVCYFERIPNNRMWEFYAVSELLISFSRTEIFGMSILEAMYYRTPVFAIHAPGPDYILEHRVSGFLSDTPEQMAEQILTCDTQSQVISNAYERVTNLFSWQTTAEIIMGQIDR